MPDQRPHFWDNIYDVSSPDDLARSGDTTPQPVSDKAYVHDLGTRPELENYSGDNDQPNNAISDRFKSDSNDAPLTQTTLSDNKRPPGMGGTRQGFFSDQSADPDKKHDTDPVDYENTHIDGEKSWQGDSAHGEVFPDYLHRDVQWTAHERLANNILAGYLLKHNPQTLDLTQRQKVSYWNLNELLTFTSDLSTKYEGGCSATLRKSRHANRYSFHVQCSEDWSDPSGHTVKMKFVKSGNKVDPLKSEVKISCSCPFWVFYGADWKSRKDDYNDTPQGNGAVPKIRGRNHMICKHVAACIPLMKGLRVTTD